jgi:HAD superfamily hydrolase (TIGR01549 family)
MIPARDDLDAVLFDWDGTLVNSAEVSFRCFESVFTGYGIPFDRAAYAATYSPNWHRTYVALGLPKERWTEADDRWVQGYCRETIPLIAGALDAVNRLVSGGLTVGLVTSGDRVRVERELIAHGLDRVFRAVVCGPDTVNKKPHPEALLLALGRLGLAPARTVYVGDSPEDVEMARNAGAGSIGIPGGFPNVDALERSRPDLLAPSLAAAVEALMGGEAPAVTPSKGSGSPR